MESGCICRVMHPPCNGSPHAPTTTDLVPCPGPARECCRDTLLSCSGEKPDAMGGRGLRHVLHRRQATGAVCPVRLGYPRGRSASPSARAPPHLRRAPARPTYLVPGRVACSVLGQRHVGPNTPRFQRTSGHSGSHFGLGAALPLPPVARDVGSSSGHRRLRSSRGVAVSVRQPSAWAGGEQASDRNAGRQRTPSLRTGLSSSSSGRVSGIRC